jgi:hypothetical protein
VRSLVEAPTLRQRLIRAGYDTARAHTGDAQAAAMMEVVARELGLALTKRPKVA